MTSFIEWQSAEDVMNYKDKCGLMGLTLGKRMSIKLREYLTTDDTKAFTNCSMRIGEKAAKLVGENFWELL